MAHNKRKQRLRRRLYNENPYCPICGVKMILPEDIPDTGTGRKKYYPDNMCTYEHKYSRLSKDRNKNEINMILCLKCNHMNGENEVAKLPLEELHRRSGRFPQITWLTYNPDAVK